MGTSITVRHIAVLALYIATVHCAQALWLPWPLRALQAGGAQAAHAPPREVPLPYSLQDKPHPRGYVAMQAARPPDIDGRLDEPAWQAAAWSDPFVDIVGPTGPQPLGGAAVKMLWDADALYVGARLEDRALFANQTLHDSIVYHDNNFEIFIDPDSNNHLYYEIEINALGTVWDLLLVRPYRNGGPAIMSWETIQPAVRTATSGPTGSRGWLLTCGSQAHEPRLLRKSTHHGSLPSAASSLTLATLGTAPAQVEVALPWSLLQQAAGGRRVPPRSGDAWRINFSRVMWTVRWDSSLQTYVKDPPDQEPFNFVWSPQYQVAMHQPETWGYVQFEELDVLTAAAPALEHDPTWPARAFLMEVYNAEHEHWHATGTFAATLQELKVGLPINASAVQDVRLQATAVSFVASASIPAPGGSHNVCVQRRAYGGGWAATDMPARLLVGAEGRLDFFFPAASSTLGYRPAEGGSRFC